jgi:ribosome-associated protein
VTDERSAERDRRRERGEPVPADLARGLAEAARDKKAEGIVILDLRGLTSMADYFVVATVTTDVHARAVAEGVRMWAAETLEERPWHVEGDEGGRNWVLLDYVDVVVHLMQPDVRIYYALERLWGDAPREEVGDGEEG